MLRAVLLSVLLTSPALAGWTIEVTAGAPGLAVEEVERTVTIPLEIGLANIPGVHVVNSATQFGVTTLSLELEAKADRLKVRQEVINRLHQVALPTGVSPVVASVGPVKEPAFWLAITGEVEPAALTRWVESDIDPALKRIPGVASIEGVGKARTELSVLLDQRRMQAYGLDAKTVTDAIAGFISTELRVPRIHTPGFQLRKAEELGTALVATKGGTPIYLRDVGTVQVQATRPSLAFDGKKPGILLGIRINEEKDAKSVRDGLATLLPELRKKLPAGASVEVVADRFGTDPKLIPGGILRQPLQPGATQPDAVKFSGAIVAKCPAGALSVVRQTEDSFEVTVLALGVKTRPEINGQGMRWVPVERLDTREQAAFVLELPVADSAAALKLLGDLVPALRKAGEAGPTSPAGAVVTQQVRLDPQKLAALGVTARHVLSLVQLGQEGRRLPGYVDGSACDAVVRIDLGRDKDVLDMQIEVKENRVVRLRDVATVEPVESLSTLRRSNGQRVWLVPLDPDETKPEAVTKVCQEALAAALKSSGAKLSSDARLWPAGAEKPIALKP
jgi:multidrug efflux pump subunit AcrB